ncbi:MAG TPA: hypothetical protein VF556_07675 [Pyrinomonadaceae bacterium]|jgi:hypothetical protein
MNHIQSLNSKQRRAAAEYIRKENAKYGDELVLIPKEKYPPAPDGWKLPVAVYRNRRFIVQIFQEDCDVLRFSVARTQIDHQGKWLDGITWDDLQTLKNQLFPDREAVEFYPALEDVVNVANMRHLWVLPEKLGFGWKSK